MPTVTQELLVFVASPGDCDAERQRVRTVAERLNESLGSQLDLRIRVTGWEYVPPDFGRPQAQINTLVDTCDVFIGILGQRWGSPTGTHTSGFLEEFDRVVERRGNTSHPPIALYFRSVPPAMAADPGPQLTAVLNFQRTIREQQLALYETFNGLDELESQLWQLLIRQMAAIATPKNQDAPEGTGTAHGASVPTTGTELETAELDDARRQIVAVTEAVTRVARGDPAAPALDQDRFLLVALSVNDLGGLIPPHVANRLYTRRGELALSVGESQLWLRTVVADIGRSPTPVSRVIPGWALVTPSEREFVDLLMSVDEDLATGVFRVLHRLRARPAALWRVDDGTSNDVIDRWAPVLRRPLVASEAIEYVAAVAQIGDVPLIDAMCEVEDTPSLRELRSLLVGDPSPMANAVATSYVTPKWKVAAVSAAMGAADDGAVRAVAMAERAPAELRRVALAQLADRNLLDDAVLEKLLTDSDMVDAVFASAEDPASSLTAGAIVSIVNRLPDNTSKRMELVARALAAASTTETLLSLLDTPLTNLNVWEALGWKRGPGLVQRARAIFDTDADELVAPLEEDDTWKGDSTLLAFVRDRARRSALRILAASEPVAEEDRERLRAEVARANDDYTLSEALVMLASVATPDDVPELLAHLPRVYGSNDRIVVDAVLAVGGAGAARKLAQSKSVDEAVRGVTALGAYPDVKDDELRDFLYSSQGSVRISALEQLAKRLDADAFRALLREYPTARGSYYYNVVAELDFRLHARFADASQPDAS